MIFRGTSTPKCPVIARVYLQLYGCIFRANAEGIHPGKTEGTRPIREGKGKRERERERPAGPSSSILAHQARFSRLDTPRTPIDAEETRIAAFISAIITASVCAARERVFRQASR